MKWNPVMRLPALHPAAMFLLMVCSAPSFAAEPVTPGQAHVRLLGKTVKDSVSATRETDYQSITVTPVTPMIGAEIGGGNPWLGEIGLVAIYCKALSAAEVAQNFTAGY